MSINLAGSFDPAVTDSNEFMPNFFISDSFKTAVVRFLYDLVIFFASFTK
jgi:hypothetical protein